MDLADALTQRRSCRTYLRDPIAEEVLGRVLAVSRRGPTAGNSWGIELLVLSGADQTARYWDVTLPGGPGPDGARRAGFQWPGLLAAPTLVIPTVRPGAYVERYAEPDKAATGLGAGTDAWPVPYWWVDAGAAVMAMLLAATAEGLGSVLFGTFGAAAAVSAEFGIPATHELVGCIALGHADPAGDRPSASLRRSRPPLGEIVHRGTWSDRSD